MTDDLAVENRERYPDIPFTSVLADGGPDRLKPTTVGDEFPVGWGDWPVSAKAHWIAQRMPRRALADAVRNMVGMGEDRPTDPGRLSHETLAAVYLALRGDL